MKKFVFSLEKVLNVKNQIYDVKKSELTVLMMELSETEKNIELTKAEFKKYNDEVNILMQNGTTSSSIEPYKRYFTVLDDKEKKLEELKAETEEKITSKQQEITEIKTEISGLEKLREKQLAEYNKALIKEQERDLEEFLNEKISGTQ